MDNGILTATALIVVATLIFLTLIGGILWVIMYGAMDQHAMKIEHKTE